VEQAHPGSKRHHLRLLRQAAKTQDVIDRAPVRAKNADAPLYQDALLKRAYRRACEQLAQAERVLAAAKTKKDKTKLKKLVVRCLARRDRARQKLEAFAAKTQKTLAEAQKKPAFHPQLVKKIAVTQDVIDAAPVRAGTSDASVHMEALLERVTPIVMKKVAERVIKGQFGEEEAKARMRKGVFIAAQKWEHDHPSGAKLSTVAFQRVRRELQLRTRADRIEGAFQYVNSCNCQHRQPTWVTRLDNNERCSSVCLMCGVVKGSWGYHCSSLDAIGEGSTGEDAFVPHAAHYSASYITSSDGEARDAARTTALAADLRDAIGQLPDDECFIAMSLLEDVTPAEIAVQLNISKAKAVAKIAKVFSALREHLVDYRQDGDL
jgi:hypothetical protein